MLQAKNDKYKGYVIQKGKCWKGNQGIVFLCTHKNFPNIQLCVKIIKNVQSIQQPEVREIEILKLLRQFNNPHLIKVFDILEIDSSFYIIMEYCKGGDLGERIKIKEFTASDILDFVTQFVDGYQVLHQNDIFHRDIKPQNIFVDEDCYIVIKYLIQIGDLGSSRMIVHDQIIDYSRTGTLAYYSPQMSMEKCFFTAKTDMYSLGMILYELVYKKLPYNKSAKDEIDNFHKQLQAVPLNLKITIKGSNEEVQEVQTLLNQLIVYDEQKRIGFKDLFMRVKKLNVYKKFLEKNNINLKQSYKVDLPQDILQQQANIECIQDQFLPSFLILAQLKINIAREVHEKFQELINSKVIVPENYYEYCFFKSALLGYIKYSYINMEAIYEIQPDKLSEHLKPSNQVQITNLMIEFKKQLTMEQLQQWELCANMAHNPYFNHFFNKTIQVINNDPTLSSHYQIVQYKQILEINNRQLDYRLFSQYTEIFYHQFIRKYCITLDRQPQQPDAFILFLGNLSLFFELELKFAQNDLFQHYKIFPVLINTREAAISKVKQNKNI